VQAAVNQAATELGAVIIDIDGPTPFVSATGGVVIGNGGESSLTLHGHGFAATTLATPIAGAQRNAIEITNQASYPVSIEGLTIAGSPATTSDSSFSAGINDTRPRC